MTIKFGPLIGAGFYDDQDTGGSGSGGSYTDLEAQNAVGGILVDSDDIDLAYVGGTSITADLIATGVTAGTYGDANNAAQIVVDANGRITSASNVAIDHDLLLNFVGNEHYDHSVLSITAGTGLTGGGDLTGSRTISIASTGVTANTYGSANTSATIAVNAQGQITSASSTSIDHNTLTNYVSNQHLNHSTISITAGTGLSGGGTIAATRTLSIANTTVTPGSYGSSSTSPTYTVNSQGQLTAAANVGIDHDALTNFVSAEHVDHSGVSITAGTGLSGGGTIESTRTISIANTGVIANTYGSATTSASIAVNAQGQITSASSANIDHDAIANFVANEHVDHSAVSITAGTGLTGGGTIASTRTLAVDYGTDIETIAATNFEGTSSTAARSDHIHASGLTSNGDILTMVGGNHTRLGIGTVGQAPISDGSILVYGHPSRFNPEVVRVLFDDFLSLGTVTNYANTFGFQRTAVGVGGVQGPRAATSGTHGVVGVATGTTTTGACILGTGNDSVLLTALTRIYMKASFAYPVAPDATNDYTGSFGFGDTVNTSTDPSYGAYIRYDRTTGLHAVTIDGGAMTSTTISGITPSSFNHYEINATSSSVEFYANGVLKATHTTGIPTSGMGMIIKIVKSAGTTSRELHTDYIYLEVYP